MATDPSPRLVLLPSPLLGPAVWGRVATTLRARGHEVLLPAPYASADRPQDVLAHLRAQIPADESVVLIPHSNAGLYVAGLAATHRATGVLFVDAGLPESGADTPTAPAALIDFLAALVEEDGRLPRWTRWWPEAEVRALFPDDAARAEVEAEQLRVPFEYFRASVPTPGGWTGLPMGYLAFGDTYAAERDESQRRGWPVERLDGRHLHMLVEPVEVAAALERLLQRVRGA